MKKLINVRLDVELLKKLDKKAAEENRSRTNLIETPQYFWIDGAVDYSMEGEE